MTDTINIEGEEFTFIQSNEEVAQVRRQEKSSMREFSLGANLAHNMAYRNNPALEKISIKEEDNVCRDYQTVKIRSGHNAINAEMYLPIGNNDQSTVYVNFTGTNSLATLHADLEHNAGEQVFHRNKLHVMAQIADAVRQVSERTGKPVTLHFSGHSLGGALAQHGLNETMRYLAANLKDKITNENEKNQIAKAEETLIGQIKKHNSRTDNTLSKDGLEQFKKVGALKISTWDSTGVSKEVEAYSNEMSNLLVKHDMDITARLGMVGGDFVQKTGQGTVLSDSDASVQVLKLDLGYEGFKRNLLKSFLTGAVCVAAGLTLGPFAAGVLGTTGFLTRAALPTIKAHTSPSGCFNEDNKLQSSKEKPIGYEKLSNDTPEGRAKIKARLQNKSSILQSSPLVMGKAALHGLGKAGSRLGVSKAGSKLGCAASYATNLISSPFRRMFGKA